MHIYNFGVFLWCICLQMKLLEFEYEIQVLLALGDISKVSQSGVTSFYSLQQGLRAHLIHHC